MARLTPDVVASIRGMRKRGDKITDIAIWYRTYGRIISQICRGDRKEWCVAPADASALPPAGPYDVISSSTLSTLREAAAVPLATLQQIDTRLQRIEEAMHAVDVSPSNQVQTLHCCGSCGAVSHRREVVGCAHEGRGRIDQEPRQLSLFW